MKKLLYIAMTCALGGIAAPAALAETTTIQASAEEKITVYSIAFKGGGWAAVTKARVALKPIKGAKKVLISGNQALILVDDSTSLDKTEIQKALRANGLRAGQIKRDEYNKPTGGVTFSGMGPGWAKELERVRATLARMRDIDFVLVDRTSVTVLYSGDKCDVSRIEKTLKSKKFKVRGNKKITNLPL